ncbi:hypothetical protein DPMN_080325, partial [Dreissena polymorpha]
MAATLRTSDFRTVEVSGIQSACISQDLENLPDALKELVTNDNDQFLDEIERWDPEAARKAAGGRDTDVAEQKPALPGPALTSTSNSSIQTMQARPPANYGEITQEMVQNLYSDDLEKQKQATHMLKKLLSKGPNPPIDEVTSTGLIPRFVAFLETETLQFDAACVLTTICSGSSQHIGMVKNANAVPVFVRLLSSEREDLQEQAVLALGKIARVSPECRNIVLSEKILVPLLQLLRKGKSSLSMTKNAVWCLSKLCSGKILLPDFEKVSPSLPILAQLLQHTDKDVLLHSCKALRYLSHEQIQAVIESGVFSRLVELLHKARCQSVASAALRVFGNIVTDDDYQTQKDAVETKSTEYEKIEKSVDDPYCKRMGANSGQISVPPRHVPVNLHGLKGKILHLKDNIKKQQRELFDTDVLKCICALLNSGGGILHIRKFDEQNHPVEFKNLDTWWQGMESKIDKMLFCDDICNYYKLVGNQADCDLCLIVEPAEHLCIQKYNCFLPRETGVQNVKQYSLRQLLAERGDPGVLKDLPLIPKKYVFEKSDKDLMKETTQIQFKLLN